MSTTPGILAAIGATPVIELRRVLPPDCARVLVKLESHNPTGSMKDRMARAVVEGAVARGQLRPGGTLVEYTGGSTGTSLAFVCVALGRAITLVSSDAFSREKRDHMRAPGATVTEVPSEGGRTTKELIQRMIAKAAELPTAPGALYADQFNDPDAAAGHAPRADELLGAVGPCARRVRPIDFIAEHDCARAARAAPRIAEATGILRDHPLIGRPMRGDIRELVISSGRTGYVALYRLRNGVARVEILTVRHQREAGYRE